MAKTSREPTRGLLTRLLDNVVSLLAQPGVMIYLTVKSEIDRIRVGTRKARIHVNRPYGGESILLLALYQKGELRPDAIRLLEAAKSFGLYVLAVNTQKLRDPGAVSHLVDTYIERPNYGRDFGSYKAGFLHLFEQGWQDQCARLLMVNDSVFFCEDRMPRFLADMFETDREVLGSTENYEINYHLGSFCISMAQSVLQHRKFQTYWKKFRLTDVRPVVIKKGEMGLSKTLKSVVTSPRHFQALYNSARYASLLRDADTKQLDEYISLVRKGDLTPAKLFNFSEQFETLSEIHTVDPFETLDLKIENTGQNEIVRTRIYVDSFTDLRAAFLDSVRKVSDRDLNGFRETVASRLLDNFRQHSQIHQNAAILLNMGLPIIKLDGVYRGMFNMADVTRLMGLLSDVEAKELEDLLISRPFGGEVLIGWKRAAFMRGLI
jgi:hypothetical protein